MLIPEKRHRSRKRIEKADLQDFRRQCCVSAIFPGPPGEAQDGTYPVTFRVADDGNPNLADTQTITITVHEVNTAPVLAALGPQTVTTHRLLRFTATATDADLPPNPLRFRLGAGAPAGATIDSVTGVFSWMPGLIQTGDFAITILVSDGSGASDSQIVQVHVADPAQAIDVSGQVSVSRGKARFNRWTRRFRQTVTLRNTGSEPIPVPLSLVLDHLPRGVRLFKRKGTTQAPGRAGSPYVDISAGADNLLMPGETTTVVLEFTAATARRITYAPRILTGSGAR
jgi:hypothetical protein